MHDTSIFISAWHTCLSDFLKCQEVIIVMQSDWKWHYDSDDARDDDY